MTLLVTLFNIKFRSIYSIGILKDSRNKKKRYFEGSLNNVDEHFVNEGIFKILFYENNKLI